jgi:hypothetical protein
VSTQRMTVLIEMFDLDLPSRGAKTLLYHSRSLASPKNAECFSCGD